MHRNAQKILRRLALDFERKHQGLVSQLDDFQVPITMLIDFSHKGIARGLSEKPSLSDAIQELVALGYLRSIGSLSVSLAESGLRVGSRSNVKRLWDFINRNPGVAILIFLLSFLLALCSFIFAIGGV